MPRYKKEGFRFTGATEKTFEGLDTNGNSIYSYTPIFSAVPEKKVQEPTKWVKRRKMITKENPEGVERGPLKTKALPHNLAKRPNGRRPARS